MTESDLSKMLVYVKAILQITEDCEDSSLKALILSAYFFVAQKTGLYIFLPDTTPEEVLIGGEGNRKIFLKKFPVTTWTSLEYNTGTQNTPDRQTYDRESYTVDEKQGVVIRTAGFVRGFQNIKATYTYGYSFDNIPDEYEQIKYAIAKIVGISKDLVAIGAITQETVSGTTIQYSKEYQDSGVSQILDSFSNISV